MTKRIHVTDHAVLRWLERVEGVNIRAIRRRIHKSAKVAVKHGASGVNANGVAFTLAYGEDRIRVVTTRCKQTRPHLAEPRSEADADAD